jgi:hypothetical protein
MLIWPQGRQGIVWDSNTPDRSDGISAVTWEPGVVSHATYATAALPPSVGFDPSEGNNGSVRRYHV